MLRALVINPDPGLENQLDLALRDTGVFGALHSSHYYPTASTLERLVRLHAPEVVFVAIHDLREALRVAAQLDEILPDVPVVAFGYQYERETPLELMRAGIREFLEPPFARETILTVASRMAQYLARHPLRVQSTDRIYSFLPAKPGAGATTVATNTSVSAARYHPREVLLADFDLHNGLVSFMLSLKAPHGVADALDQSASLDEALWPQLVTEKEGLDVLASTGVPTGYRVNPADLENVIRVARRLYQFVFLDLPGNIEESSFELMQESKQIFLVATPEIAVLHLARKKLETLTRLNLQERVRLVLNRWSENSLISRSQIEEMLGLPIDHTIANEYQAIYRTQLAGRAVTQNSKLGAQLDNLARDILGRASPDDASADRPLFRYAARLVNRWRGKVSRIVEEAPPRGGSLPPVVELRQANLPPASEPVAGLLPEPRPGDSTARSGGISRPEAGRKSRSRTSRIPEARPFGSRELAEILAACQRFTDASESEHQDLNASLRALVLLLRYSGLRLQEAVTISRDRIVGDRLLLSKPTSAKPAWCQLPKAVIDALGSCSRNGSNHFFLDRLDESQTAIQFWRSRLDKVFELAGVTDGDAIRFRDTYAVELIEANASVETVATHLGHKNPSATRRRYNRWIRQRQNNTALQVMPRHTSDTDRDEIPAPMEVDPDPPGPGSLRRFASQIKVDRKSAGN